MTTEITNEELERLKEAHKKIMCYFDPRDANVDELYLVVYKLPSLIAKVESLAADAEMFRGEGWLCAMDSIASRLPSTYYMDPPDGGSIRPLEQLERMAKDAERYRWLRDRARDSVGICPIVVMMDEGGAVIGDEIDCHGIRAESFLDKSIDAAMAKEKA